MKLRRILGNKFVRVVTILLVVGLPAGLWLRHWSASPSETSIHIITNAQPASTTVQAFQPLQSRFFATEIPDDWKTRTNSDTTTNTQLLTLSPPGSNGQIGFSVAPLPNEGLTGVADYTLRIKDSQTYRQVHDPQFQLADSVFYSVENGPSYTAFLLHNGKYASVAVSDTSSPAMAHDLLVHALQKWQWL